MKFNFFKKITTATLLSTILIGIVPDVIPNSQPQTVYASKKRVKKFPKMTVTTVDNQDDLGFINSTKKAIKAWNKKTRANLVYVPNYSKANIIVHNDPTDSNLDKNTLGATEPKAYGQVNIYINTPLVFEQDDPLSIAIEHEIGHALGLGHLKYHHSIMYPDDTYKIWITKRDAKNLNRIFKHVWETVK